MARRIDGLPKLITRGEIAEFLGVDRRRYFLKNLRPVAWIELGGHPVDLFEASILPAVSVNAKHPIKQSEPEI